MRRGLGVVPPRTRWGIDSFSARGGTDAIGTACLNLTLSHHVCRARTAPLVIAA